MKIKLNQQNLNQQLLFHTQFLNDALKNITLQYRDKIEISPYYIRVAAELRLLIMDTGSNKPLLLNVSSYYSLNSTEFTMENGTTDSINNLRVFLSIKNDIPQKSYSYLNNGYNGKGVLKEKFTNSQLIKRFADLEGAHVDDGIDVEIYYSKIFSYQVRRADILPHVLFFKTVGERVYQLCEQILTKIPSDDRPLPIVLIPKWE